jgi:hypothetical protein
MKKVVVMVAVAMVAAVFTVQAQDAAAPAAAPAPAAPATPPAPPKIKKEMPAAVDLELVGKVIQQEKIQKDKAGAEVKRTVIALDIAADGIQVVLPMAKKNGVDPAAFVGKDVKVFGKGWSEVNKKGKKTIRLQKIDKIEPLAP